MTKPKTLEQLRAEKERAETQLAQEKHKLCHFGACEIFDLRGKALNRAAQIAKTMGAFLPPTVPGSDCIASITASTATTHARAA